MASIGAKGSRQFQHRLRDAVLTSCTLIDLDVLHTEWMPSQEAMSWVIRQRLISKASRACSKAIEAITSLSHLPNRKGAVLLHCSKCA